VVGCNRTFALLEFWGCLFPERLVHHYKNVLRHHILLLQAFNPPIIIISSNSNNNNAEDSSLVFFNGILDGNKDDVDYIPSCIPQEWIDNAVDLRILVDITYCPYYRVYLY
jgi:hypothetical protein